MSTLHFHPAAELEVLAVESYYLELSSELGSRFGQAFEQTIAAIEADPLISAINKDGCRHRKIKGFPHRAVYEVHESAELILILAIAHPSRRPGYWKYRRS